VWRMSLNMIGHHVRRGRIDRLQSAHAGAKKTHRRDPRRCVSCLRAMRAVSA
jgi:hypothetical protein